MGLPKLFYSRYISNGIYVLEQAPMLKLFFKAGKNAWTSDLKWRNYVVCQDEVGLLFND